MAAGLVAHEAGLDVGEGGVGLRRLGLAEAEAGGGAGALPLRLHLPLEPLLSRSSTPCSAAISRGQLDGKADRCRREGRRASPAQAPSLIRSTSVVQGMQARLSCVLRESSVIQEAAPLRAPHRRVCAMNSRVLSTSSRVVRSSHSARDARASATSARNGSVRAPSRVGRRADGAPQDAPQHVAPSLVAGHDAVGDEEGGGARVLRHDAHRRARSPSSARRHAGGRDSSSILGDDGTEEVGLVHRALRPGGRSPSAPGRRRCRCSSAAGRVREPSSFW